MRMMLCLLVCVCSLEILNALPPMSAVRAIYRQAPEQEDQCEKLLHQLRDFDENNNPLLGGYKASAKMMMAKYTFNPLSKLNRFNEGKQLLEKCIAADLDNIELRFLRFAAQTSVPSFLMYNMNVDPDKHFILTSLPKLNDAELKLLIVSFMKRSDHLTKAEKEKLRSF